jgi:hypothetical protein
VAKERTVSYFSRSHLILSAVIALSSVFSYIPHAEASQQVVLKYRIFQQNVSVRELRTLADTGKASDTLKFYLDKAGKEPDDLRRALTQEVKVNPTLLYRVLNSPIGEGMLDQASQVIHTPSKRADIQSLRGALVSSALDDGNITLIETLENYPTQEVYLEGDRVAEVMQNINRWINRFPRFGS